jgi:hypothetical protein
MEDALRAAVLDEIRILREFSEGCAKLSAETVTEHGKQLLHGRQRAYAHAMARLEMRLRRLS